MPKAVPRQFSAETSQRRSRPNQITVPAKRLADARARADRRRSAPRGPRAEALEDLGLGLRDGVHRVEELEVGGPHVGDDGDVGLRDAATGARSSPGADMPSSSTAAVCSAARRSRVRGRPYWLLRLPSVRSTGPRVARSGAVMSLVVVLPVEPVMATTGSVGVCRAVPREVGEGPRGVGDADERAGPGRRPSTFVDDGRGRPCAGPPRGSRGRRSGGPRSRRRARPGRRVRESMETPVSGGSADGGRGGLAAGLRGGRVQATVEHRERHR